MRIALISIVTALLCPPAGLMAQQAQAIVLKVRSSQPSADGKTTLVTLASGARVAIPVEDIDDNLTSAVHQTTAAQSKPVSGDAQPTLDTSIIRPKCAKEWPDDFAVRAFCEKTQNEAVEQLRARPMSSPDQRTIRNKCAKEWPDDFAVRNFCEKTQLEALKKVGR